MLREQDRAVTRKRYNLLHMFRTTGMYNSGYLRFLHNEKVSLYSHLCLDFYRYH